MSPKTKKDRLSYLINSLQIQGEGELTSNESLKSPAVYLLTHAVNLNKSLRYCMEQFPSKDRTLLRTSYKSLDKLTAEGQKVIRRLSASAFVAMMGHFDIYQRLFVSGLFEATRFIRSLNMDTVMKRILGDARDNGIRIIDLAAYRGEPAYIGGLLTDNLSGWHNPQRVNEIVKAMLEKIDFYSSKDIEYLTCLWQIRHAIAHSGGWLTLPAAQKVPQLKSLGDRPIFFDHNFIRQVHEEFHNIVKDSVDRASAAFKQKIESDYSGEDEERFKILHSEEIEMLFKVGSPRGSHLRR